LPLIFEYVLEAFEKTQDSVKNRIAVMENPLLHIGFQPSRVGRNCGYSSAIGATG
jgi:hypothetical protein